MWGKSRQNRRLLDKAIFRFLGASAKVFVFGALRHQLLYEFGDAAMSSSLRSSISFWVVALSSMCSVARRSTMPVAVLEVIVAAR